MSIITLTEYKTYAGVPVDNTKNDDKLQSLVDFVNSFIENYCGTSFELNTTKDRVTSADGLEVVLSNAPVTEVSEVLVSGVEYPLEDIIIDKAEGTFEVLNSISTNRLAIEVSYTYGYNGVPADVTLSALEFVTHLQKREFTKSRNMGNGESADYGDPALIPAQVRLGLNMYRYV